MTTSVRTRQGAYTCPFKHTEPSEALIPYIQPYFKKRSIYIEPMVGAGSVLINILKTSSIDDSWAFKEYRMYDLNHLIISTWNVIKDNPQALINGVRNLMDEILRCFAKNNGSLKLFLMNLHVKSLESKDDLEKATFFLVMNKVLGVAYLCAINSFGNSTKSRSTIIERNCTTDAIIRSIISTHEALSMAKGKITFETKNILDLEPPLGSSIFVDFPREKSYTKHLEEFIGSYVAKVASWAASGNELVVVGRQFHIDLDERFLMVPIEFCKMKGVLYSYT